MTYHSTKLLGPFSTCFRQWRANTHCKFLHGYGLTFLLTFETDELDHHNWVVDFGSLRWFKDQIADQFDHRLLVAEDDPLYRELIELSEKGGSDHFVVEKVGCEAFAELVGEKLICWLNDNGYSPRVRVKAVECREHEQNSAVWINDATV